MGDCAVVGVVSPAAAFVKHVPRGVLYTVVGVLAV